MICEKILPLAPSSLAPAITLQIKSDCYNGIEKFYFIKYLDKIDNCVTISSISVIYLARLR
jgi:hypothetical protein